MSLLLKEEDMCASDVKKHSEKTSSNDVFIKFTTTPGHKRHWDTTTGLKQAKGLIFGPSAKRTKDLLKLNRDQLRWVAGLLTGHCHLKGHLFKMGLTDDPICERCLEDDESATYIICDCEALAILSSYQPVVFPFENDGETSR
jgi:hypothetical protein